LSSALSNTIHSLEVSAYNFHEIAYASPCYAAVRHKERGLIRQTVDNQTLMSLPSLVILFLIPSFVV